MKKLIAILLAAVMLLGLAACGGGTAASGETSGAAGVSSAETSSAETSSAETSAAAKPLKMQWFQAGGIDTLFESPWKDCQSILSFVVFETLLEFNSDGSYVGKLATDYKVSDDGLTYTFAIRQGVTWHDGEPFSIDDVVWSLHAGAKVAGSWATGTTSIAGYQDYIDGKADTISGIKADGNNLVLTLAAPNRVFASEISKLRILPKHCLGEVADENLLNDATFWAKPVGTGAYKIDKVSFPDYCTITAYDGYYGAQPGVKEMLFTNYNAGGNDAVTAALIAGDLDFAWGNAVNDIEVANNISAQNSDVSVMMQTSTYNRYIAFNLIGREDGKDKNDLKNVKVRQAINLLIDKDAFASLYNGQATALSTFVNPDSEGYNKDIPLFERNVDQAKKLLSEAGFDFSQTLDLVYYYDDQTTADAMAMLTQNFADAGITLNCSLLTGDLSTQLYTTRNYDLLYASSGAPVNPNLMYKEMTSSGGSCCLKGYAELGPIFDAAYNAWLAATDDATAQTCSNKLQALGLENCYMIPIYCLNTIEMYNSAVVTIPQDIFEVDTITPARNWKLDEWHMN